MRIKELPIVKDIKASGRYADFKFTQIKRTENAYLYEVEIERGGVIHYEIFERKLSPPHPRTESPDFDLKVVYPSEEDFGFTAWTVKDFNKAVDRLYLIQEKVDKRALGEGLNEEFDQFIESL